MIKLLFLLFMQFSFAQEVIIYTSAPIIARQDILVITSFYQPDFDGYHTKTLSVHAPDYWYYHVVGDRNPHIQHHYAVCWITNTYLQEEAKKLNSKPKYPLYSQYCEKKKKKSKKSDTELYDISEDEEEKENE